MGTTIQEARDAIKVLIDHQTKTGERVITEESLRNIIKDLSLDAGSGKTTVLYSGVGTLPTSLTSDPNIRILDNTQASKFLLMATNGDNTEFVEALTMLYGEDPDLSPNGGVTGNKANIFVNGITTDPRTTGLWDMISDTFVRGAPSDSQLIALIGENANPNAVFMGTEWKAVQESGKYAHVNDVPINDYKASIADMSTENILNKFKSDTVASIAGMSSEDFVNKLKSDMEARRLASYTDGTLDPINLTRAEIKAIITQDPIKTSHMASFDSDLYTKTEVAKATGIPYNEMISKPKIESDTIVKNFMSSADEATQAIRDDINGKKLELHTNATVSSGLNKYYRDVSHTEAANFLTKTDGSNKTALNYIANFTKENDIDAVGFSKTLTKLGPLGDVLAGVLILSAAADAYEGGDTEGAKQILIDGTIDQIGSILGEVAFAALAVALVGVGSIPAAIFVGGMAIFGGIFGSKFASDLNNAIFSILNPTDGHPFAPENFNPPRRDPLVLDLNKDGLISTVSLADSTAFFDLTGDGIKEKVGWIQASEGIVAFDKNGNGKIDGISEVFGTATTSGFAELRSLADSNYDGVIDRRDEFYNQLKVWQDANQDGISQASELKTLSQAGVNNIELNVFATNINLNGNLLTEAGRYSDSTGTRSLAADVELTFDARITTVDTSLIPDYTIHPDTAALPKLRGYGTVYNSEIAYNVNDNLRNLAIGMSHDITAVAKNFDTFLEEWSGLNTLLKTAQTKHNLTTTPILSEMDKKVWIYEHFMGDSRFSSGIEARILSTAQAMKAGGSADVRGGTYNTVNVNRAYSNVKDRYQAVFTLQALYPEITDSTLTYNLSTDEFVLSDPSAFTTNVSAYMNSSTESLEKKLFLADVMNTLETTFLDFSAVNITAGITDPLMRELVSGIYAGTYKANVYGNGIYTSGNILAVGSENSDAITISSSTGSTILAGTGDDVIHGSTGNDVYLYRTGDGRDTIIDGGGNDTLRLTDMLQSDIVLRKEGNDLVIGRAVDGKTFDELTDTVTLVNWINSSNRVENIRFSDGSTFDFTNVINTYFVTEAGDVLDLSASNDTLDALGGNDSVHGLGGNDTLNGGAGDDILYGDAGDDVLNGDEGNDTLIGGEGNDTLQGATGVDTLNGGTGNDTYIYNFGDGKDTIIDGAGVDTLRLGAGIDVSMLAVQYLSNGDMVIALKEEGKSFTELSDVITIKSWNNPTNRLENILLSDGTAINLDALQIGTESDDILTFGDNGVTIDLLGGNDTVTSGNGNDIIDGGAGNDTINAGNGTNQITAGEGNDTVTSGSGADTISGGAGNDTINSGSGNDTLSGNEGDDLFIAGDGNDTLSGGTGVDVLQGGVGNDLYLYSRGDGKDTIIDAYNYGYNGSSQSNAGNDTLKFSDGITTNDLIAQVVGEDLIIALKEDGKTFNQLSDVITIKNWVNTNNRIETIALFDGTIVDLATIQSATQGNDSLVYGDSATVVDTLEGDDVVITGTAADTVHGGAGNDTLRSGDGNDSLYGDEGNDTLIAGSGNDTLEGGEGNDTLYGENGNDTLSGNAGTDTLVGGLGDDLYVFNLGDGRDTIIDEYPYGSGGNDTLRFGEGITKADLVARAVSGSNDLQIGIKEGSKAFNELSDIVTLKNWFDTNKRIENITLFDGTVVSLGEMQGGTDGDDYLVFGDSDTLIDALGGDDTVITANGNDTLGGGAGNDILISNNGNDTLGGGEGNDTLKAGTGNDTLSGGSGIDTLEGGSGNDTYIFGRGDGKDRIIDSAGNDTLHFADGITKDNLIARFISGSDDLQIALREDGMSFDQLSDVITITGWRNSGQRVENFLLNDGTIVTLTDIERSTAGDDYLVFGDEGVSVDALAGNDTLITGDGADTVSGEDGNDTILSGKGNDTLSGGKGADALRAGSGNDTYLFNRGDGADNVFDEQGADVLKFGDGITKDDLIFKQQGNSLLIGIAEVNKTFDQLNDVVTLTDWFKSNTSIETITFTNNTSMTQSDIAGLFVANDIHGALYSKPGAVMYGGSGDTTYVYSRGDFTVVIDDQHQQGQIDVNAGSDTLYLSGGINKNDVTFGVVGNDLILKITPKVETYEQLRDYVVIKNWANANRGIEKVIFSDGENLIIDKNETYPATTFNYGWVSSQYLICGDDVNSIIGTAFDETFETNGGDDIVDAGEGNNIVYGGTGNDILKGGHGNDAYIFNKGDGVDTIIDSGGIDTLSFGEGITVDDLMVQRDGANLIVALKESGIGFASLSDKITLKDWYYSTNLIETFKLSNTHALNADTINSMAKVNDTKRYAMKFDGLDDMLVLSNSEGLNASTALSLTTKFSYNGMGTGYQSNFYGMIVTKGYTNGSASYYLYVNADGTITFDVIGGNAAAVSKSVLTTGQMYDVAAIYDKTSGISKIYIDGVLDNEVNVGVINIAQTSEPIRIGAYSRGGAIGRSFLNGTVSDVQIYDRVLSAVEVMSIANEGHSASGLLAGYNFEGFNLLEDNSGNGHTANISGNPLITEISNTTFSPPILLDLNYNKVTSVSLTDSHTYFDYAADGLKEHTAWIEKGDALLVRDLNSDGIINDGSELFGDKTKLSDGSLAADGYVALAQYDANSDGVIDKNDTDFAQLKLWKDANLNGKTDTGELVDLSVAGITSLSLNRTNGSVYTQTTENGNIVTNETNYTTLSDTGTMRDVWFQIDATDTITDNDTVYSTTDNETLSGDVGNDTYVIAFGGGLDVIDDNGNGADTIKFISGITSDRLVVQWIRGTDDLRIGIRENAEDDTSISELPNTLTIKNWFNETGTIEQFSFSDGSALNRQDIYNHLLDVEGDLTMRVLDAGDTLSGNSGNDVLYGLEGSEMLYGKEGSDYLSGLSGDDYLSAGAGDDTLEGGSGNDTMEGGVGDDYYLFEKGDGKDLIIDVGGADTIYFGDGIVSRDVIINEVGEDLVLAFTYDSETNIDNIDQITIKNWTTNDFKIESLSFADGHEYSISALIAKNTNHAPEMFFEENERNLGKERSAKGILLADDSDGDALTYNVVNAPTMGTISINQYGIWTYTGTSRDAGTDTIIIAIQDGRGGETTTTLSFVMEALSQTPEAPTESTHTLQDIRILSGEVGATDIDGDILTYTIATAAQHGTLTIDENGTWNYAATAGYMGTDSAVITIDDTNGGVITQTILFDIKVSAPTLADATSNLLEDNSSNGTFNVVNPIGGTLTYEVVSATTNGDFTLDVDGNWSYNPSQNYNGADAVTVKVTNAYGLSATATLNLAIEAVNDAPILTETPESKTLLAGTSTTGTLKASDVDGDDLSYSVTTAPQHGTLTLNDQGEYAYTAERYYAGDVSAMVEASDGHGGSVATTLNFTNLMTPDWQYTYSGETMTINDSDGSDTLMMNNLSMADLTFLQEGNNLRIDVKDNNDVILTDYFTSPAKGVESIQTSQGTINLSKDKVGASGGFWFSKWGSAAKDLLSGSANNDFISELNGDDTLFGNSGNDTLNGENNNDLLIGGEGNDTLLGGNGDDTLYGDNGNDTLSGEVGNDKLLGGTGTNTLRGGEGNDTYFFGKGSSNTTINEGIAGFNLFGKWIGQQGGNDTIMFGEGITKEDISFIAKGNDLLLQYGDYEFITINNQKSEGNRIEKLQLNDDSYLTNADMDKIIQQINAYSKDHGFHINNNTQVQNNQALMTIVAGGWHTL